MAKAIETVPSGLRIGHASLGARGDVQGSARQETYDGDTVIVDPDNPLRVYPFELRFLSRRTPPERWVIDLSAGDDLLRRPAGVPPIPNVEDRLFVPAEYVAPLRQQGLALT